MAGLPDKKLRYASHACDDSAFAFSVTLHCGTHLVLAAAISSDAASRRASLAHMTALHVWLFSPDFSSPVPLTNTHVIFDEKTPVCPVTLTSTHVCLLMDKTCLSSYRRECSEAPVSISNLGSVSKRKGEDKHSRLELLASYREGKASHVCFRWAQWQAALGMQQALPGRLTDEHCLD